VNASADRTVVRGSEQATGPQYAVTIPHLQQVTDFPCPFETTPRRRGASGVVPVRPASRVVGPADYRSRVSRGSSR
jgi:hypothetical protein